VVWTEAAGAHRKADRVRCRGCYQIAMGVVNGYAVVRGIAISRLAATRHSSKSRIDKRSSSERFWQSNFKAAGRSLGG